MEEVGARVSVTGDVSRVELIGDNGRFGPGVVPAGAYRVVATFSAAGFPLPQGSITVSEGQQVEIRCDGTFMRCEVQ